jgi:uncharacterized protein
MSAANIALVQSLYAAFGRGDIATIIAALSANVDWRVNGRPEDYPLFGPRKGPNAVEDFFRRVAEMHDFSEFSPREFHAVDDKVIVIGKYTGTVKKSRRAFATDWVHVFALRVGKVAGFQEFTDTAQFVGADRG